MLGKSGAAACRTGSGHLLVPGGRVPSKENSGVMARTPRMASKGGGTHGIRRWKAEWGQGQGQVLPAGAAVPLCRHPGVAAASSAHPLGPLGVEAASSQALNQP